MSVIARVEPLFLETHLSTREVVCKVTIFSPGQPPRAHIMYFDADISEGDLEAEVAGKYEVSEVHIQATFYLPERPFDDGF